MKIIIILAAVAVLSFIIAKASGESTEEAAEGAFGAAMGCFMLIIQLILAALSIWFTLAAFSWLFS